MDVIIISHFTGDLDRTYNSRFTYLCDLLNKEQGVSIELVTSDFSHSCKDVKHPQKKLYDYKIVTLHESGYKKNVCLKRFVSHHEFGKNVEIYLKNRKKPDVIYCAVPSLDCAYYALVYAKKNNVRFIIDIQDLWPEAFKMVLDVPVVSNIIFSPMTCLANKIYSSADAIVAVSKMYLQKAIKNNQTLDREVVYLGTEKDSFDSYVSEQKYENNIIRIAYIGTLGNSYDIENVIKAVSNLEEKKFVQLIVMGDGPLKQKFEEQAKKESINCVFTGLLPYEEMVKLLKQCDIAVNPIRKGSAGSIINKVNDYAMAGLPVVNTQECVEYRKMLKKYKAGLNCKCEDYISITHGLERLIRDKSLRNRMGMNSRKMGEELFDREVTYTKIISLILNR